MQLAELGTEVLKLNEEDRSDLLGIILDSLSGPDPHDSPDGDSLSEAIQRGNELKSGIVEGIPEEEFMNEMRTLRGK